MILAGRGGSSSLLSAHGFLPEGYIISQRPEKKMSSKQMLDARRECDDERGKFIREHSVNECLGPSKPDKELQEGKAP